MKIVIVGNLLSQWHVEFRYQFSCHTHRKALHNWTKPWICTPYSQNAFYLTLDWFLKKFQLLQLKRSVTLSLTIFSSCVNSSKAVSLLTFPTRLILKTKWREFNSIVTMPRVSWSKGAAISIFPTVPCSNDKLMPSAASQLYFLRH